MPRRAAPDLTVTGLYSKDEACRMLCIGFGRMRALVESGQLSIRTIENSDLITGASIARYLDIPLTNMPLPECRVVTPKTQQEILRESREAMRRIV